MLAAATDPSEAGGTGYPVRRTARSAPEAGNAAAALPAETGLSLIHI